MDFEKQAALVTSKRTVRRIRGAAGIGEGIEILSPNRHRP